MSTPASIASRSRLTRGSHARATRAVRTLGLGVAAMFALGCHHDTAPQVPTALVASGTIVLSAPVGTLVSIVPTVTLRDANGNPIAGAWVHFGTTGGATVASDSARTAASGVADAGSWTLGTVAGRQTVVATSAGVPSVTFTADAVAGAPAKAVRLTPELAAVTVNLPTAQPLSVRVTDQYDNPIAGQSVTFTAPSGNGAIAGAVKTTGSDGVATADSWTVGTTAGTQQARADVAGLASIVFSVNTLAAAPAALTMVSGDGASGVVNASLATFGALPSVKVTDSYGNPVAGIAVTFTPGTNSGTVTGGATQTNSLGVATITDWVLGTAASETLVATSTALPGRQVAFTATVSTSQFNITVRYIDPAPSARQQLAVTRAVEKWKSVVTSNSGTSRVVLNAGACGRSWMPAINETVTNVLIIAKIGTIDGPGNVLGNANSCVLHSTGAQLTVLGTMFFDSEDLAGLEGNGLIDAVILHEMGHVLGIGSQWSSKGVISGRGTTDPIFTGANALTQFALIGGTTYSGRPVPVENQGGSGTADVHWRESVFKNEIMTGYLNSGTNPMSRVTIASLQDLGYSVLLSAADAYTLASSIVNPFDTSSSIALGNDIVETTLFTTDINGKRGVPRQK